MPAVSQSDSLLIDRVQRGDQAAWRDLIARFEGRLLAFVEARAGRRSAGEDIVQETFLGFLTSLPNYDRRRPLEGYLFSIASHKLTDHLRREGRRPTLSLLDESSRHDQRQPAAPGRAVSSLVRGDERRWLEEQSLAAALAEEIVRLGDRGDWDKLACLELLFIRCWANQTVAARLGMTEQAVASAKFEFVARLRALMRKKGLSADVFPELCESPSDGRAAP